MDKGYSLTKAKQESHGHVKNKKTAEKIKDNILANKKENSRSIYILECYIRVTDKTYKHHEWICGLYESKVNKGKKYYYNANRGGV